MAQPRLSMRRYYSYGFALAFWLLCMAPLLKPGLSIDTLPTSFLGREAFVQGFNYLRFSIGDQVFPTVLVGKDRQLYATGQMQLSGYQRTNRFTEAELQAYQGRLDELNDRLQQKGITFLVVIAPDKSTIYPQDIPDAIKVTPGNSRLGQLIRYMKQHGQTPIVDLRSDLAAAAKQDRVYYRTDIHWTYVGTYIAYTRVLDALAVKFPELQPHALSDYQVLSAGKQTLALANVSGLPFLKEEVRWLSPQFPYQIYRSIFPIPPELYRTFQISQNADSHLPSLLVFRDSFFEPVVSLLEPHFSRITSIATRDPRYASMDLVDVARPDVVILEFTEGLLMTPDQTIPAFK